MHDGPCPTDSVKGAYVGLMLGILEGGAEGAIVGCGEGITDGIYVGELSVCVGPSVGNCDGGDDGTAVGGAGHSTALPDVHDTELHAVPNCALHRLG